MTREHSLAQLLASCLSVTELRIWLVRREDTANFGQLVDFGGAPIEVYERVVATLTRRGLVDASFFADLERELPGRAADIHAEASRWTRQTQPPPQALTQAPTQAPVRILHLSDLHVQHQTDWDASPLRVRLVQSVARLREQGQGPDLIVLTGDVANTGDAKEYKLAESWLKDKLLPGAGLGPQDLFIVPGNHDVDRGACASVMVRALEESLRQGPQDQLAKALSDPNTRKQLNTRYKHYLAFLGRLGVAHECAPSWAFRRELRGVGLHLVGLDTAWLASGNEVKGKLLLGLPVLNAVLPAGLADAKDWVLALAHHPLSWMTERDEVAVQKALRARADLLLRGHLHAPDYTLVRSIHHKLLELPAGATYGGHGWPMSFQFIELGPAKAWVRIRLYTWSADADQWLLDRTTMNGKDEVQFDLT